jgi:hypothetical protein
MDLKATWEEHKKFIVSTGSGALVFAVLASAITGSERSAEALARSNANQQSELLRTVSNLVGLEASEKGKKNALEETAAPAILRSIAWTVDKSFVLGANDKAQFVYPQALVNASDEVTQSADHSGTKLPRGSTNKADLGLDDNPTLDGARASEALAKVDLARRIALAAIEAGARKLLQIRPGEATYQPLDGGAGFLRRLPVGITFEGGTQELAALLATFEQEGRFLEVAQCHVGRVKDARPEEGRLEIELELAAFTVEKEAPAGAQDSPKSPDNPGRTPPVRRRRDR